MNISILSIGNEILTGKTINTNANFIAENLNKIGFNVKEILTIADDKVSIRTALDYLFTQSQIVVTSGGLGPTSDDITKKEISSYFNRHLIKNNEVAKSIMKLFKKNTMDEHINLQSMIPENSKYFINRVGTAPAVLIEDKERTLIMLPGVPNEMKYFIENEIVPYLIKHYEVRKKIVYNVKTSTIPEVRIYETLKNGLSEKDMSYIGFYPSYGIVDIRISGTDEDAERILKIKKTVFNLLHKFIFTEDFRSVEQVLGDKLNERGLTLGLGESLTGGLIGERITSVPGSSDYFMGAAITYSNKSKIDILKVESCTIEKYGAVSAEVCLEMVEGVKKRFNVDCAIATTGIAGPGGGSKNKPVGLVFIGVSLFDKVILKRYTLSGNRNMIRERATNYSIFNLIKLLERSK